MIAIGLSKVFVISVFCVFTFSTAVYSDEYNHRIAKATEMFDLLDVESRFIGFMEAMYAAADSDYKALYEKIKESNIFASEEEKEEFSANFVNSHSRFIAELRSIVDKETDFTNTIIDIYVPIYADLYSVDELQQMIEFYKSPVGQKLIYDQPARMARANSEVMNQIGLKLEKTIQAAQKAEEEKLIEAINKRP